METGSAARVSMVTKVATKTGRYPAASRYLNPDAVRGGTPLVYLGYARGNRGVSRDNAEIGVSVTCSVLTANPEKDNFLFHLREKGKIWVFIQSSIHRQLFSGKKWVTYLKSLDSPLRVLKWYENTCFLL